MRKTRSAVLLCCVALRNLPDHRICFCRHSTSARLSKQIHGHCRSLSLRVVENDADRMTVS